MPQDGAPSSIDVLAAQVREIRAFAQKHAEANPDFGPLFFRDVVRLCDDVAALMARVTAWMEPFDGSGREWHESLPSPYTYQASDFSKLVAAVHEYECALADGRNALEEIESWPISGYHAGAAQRTAREVLARLDGSSE